MNNHNSNTSALVNPPEVIETALSIIAEYIPPGSDEGLDKDKGFSADEALWTDEAKKMFEKLIDFLASLPPHQYEEIRREVARQLGIKVSKLDSYVNNAKKINNGDDGSLFPEIEPWPEAVNPEELLSEISETIRRFVVCEPETALVATLWAAMTWFIDEIQVAPLALITAPEKRCGKTQLLSIFGKISYRPLPSSNISPAALFRSIDKWQPTLLIDEADAFLRDNEELRGLLNAGHTRDSAFTLRCVGENHEPKKFNLWGAKALAGIGTLADTLMDRSIIMELRRKLPDEKVERLRHAPEDLFKTLAKKLARFAEDYRDDVKAARPKDIPEALNDRAQDNWEAFLAVADTAGNDYGRLAREAAIKLSACYKEEQSEGVELLADIYEIFESKEIDRIHSDALIKELCSNNEKRWAYYNFRNKDQRITPKQLGKLLSAYDIKSGNMRGIFNQKTEVVKKGYYRRQFEDAFKRYLSFYSATSETGATSATKPDNDSTASTGKGFTVSYANIQDEDVDDM